LRTKKRKVHHLLNVFAWWEGKNSEKDRLSTSGQERKEKQLAAVFGVQVFGTTSRNGKGKNTPHLTCFSCILYWKEGKRRLSRDNHQ